MVLAACGLEEHVQVSLIFEIIASFTLFTTVFTLVYEFNPGPETSLFFFDVRRTVPYFYVLRKRVF
jgi:hypothetical protein